MMEQQMREAVIAYGRKLVESGLVQGTWGNISVRLDADHMLVTPSGLDYQSLQPEDIVKVNLRTLEYKSARKPTTEKKLHQAILLARPECGAVIHTHSANCSVYAAAGATIPIKDAAMRKRFGGDVRCAAHALPGTSKLSRATLKALEERSACLLQNHGVICCGSSLADAYELCEMLEREAELMPRAEDHQPGASAVIRS